MRAVSHNVEVQPGPRRRVRTHSASTNRSLLWYVWDRQAAAWTGPETVEVTRSAARKELATKLRSAVGRSWFGPVTCAQPGGPEHRMFALIHDLGDCVVSLLYCDESKSGPAEVTIVVPEHRRVLLRQDFAFEALAFLGFLGVIPQAGNVAVHDGIQDALKAAEANESLVFTVSTGLWPSDCDLALSLCTENIAAAAMDWLCVAA